MERFNYEWKYIPGRENVSDPLSRNPNLYSISVEDQTEFLKFDEDIDLNFIALADALDINVSAHLGASETLLPKFIEGYKVDPFFVKGMKSRDITVSKEGLYMKTEQRITQNHSSRCGGLESEHHEEAP